MGRPISRGSASGRASLLGVFNKWMLKMRNFKSWPRIQRAFAVVTFRMTGQSVERVGKLLTRPIALAHLTTKEPYVERTKHLITLSGSRTARCCINSWFHLNDPNTFFFSLLLKFLNYVLHCLESDSESECLYCHSTKYSRINGMH